MKREPQCRYFHKCGGCQTQHITYDVQLTQKKERIAKLLQIPTDSLVVVHANEYAYRNRMDFIFSHRGLGLRKQNDHKTIIPITRCEIASPNIQILLEELTRDFSRCDYFDTHKKTGTFKFAVIRVGQEKTIIFTLNQDSTKIDDATKRIEEFAKKTSADNIIVSYVQKNENQSLGHEYYCLKGNEFLTQDIAGTQLTYHSLGFFQNNPSVASQMVLHAKKLLKQTQGHLLDLYGGIGTFGIVCAPQFQTTTIIEEVENSILCANKNIQTHKLQNVQAKVLNAQNIHKLSFQKPLHVITDPPRSGMTPKTIQRLLDLQPQTIIYVSCNPQQLAKELKFFLKNYTLSSTTLFDMFAQTHHCEVLCEFKRKS